MSVKAKPDGYHTITPHIVCENCAEAIAFYKKAFGAQEVLRMPTPDGSKIMHAEMKIGDSVLMLCDPMTPDCTPDPSSPTAIGLHLYVDDADATFAQATAAGATEKMPLMDAFWGDRYGQLSDPYGHTWSIATHKQDLTPEQMAQGAQEWFQNTA